MIDPVKVLLAVFSLVLCGVASSGESGFPLEDTIRSADLVRERYNPSPTLHLYQGNGRFGTSYGSLGLQSHPTATAQQEKFGKVRYFHLDHVGRGKFGADYLIPLAEVHWLKDPANISNYRQHQSYYDGTITTSFQSGSGSIEVKSWFDAVEKNLGAITIHASQPGLQVVIDPAKSFKLHYNQNSTQTVSIKGKSPHWQIALECLGKKSLLHIHTNAEAIVRDNALVLTLSQGENSILLSYGAASASTAAQSLERTTAWWHSRWNSSACIRIPEEKAQKTWVRSMAMFLSSYDASGRGLGPPMGFSGNGWPFYFPQDVSFIHPVLLASGNLDIARSWIEHWSANADGLRKYTRRFYKVDGIMAPWVFPYGGFDGYHEAAPPNKFYFQIHNAGYLARMAHETAVHLDDPAWTRKHALPLIKGTADFFKAICTRGKDGLWHLQVTPSMGQDERGGANQKDYLCALYSAQYCFLRAIQYDLDPDGTCARILKDGLAFETLASGKGYYYSCHGRGKDDLGKQKHPVQLNELAFLPVTRTPSPAALAAYRDRYDITMKAKEPYFFGWTLGEFLLAGSRTGDTTQWLRDWENMEKSDYVDPEWLQIYETSHEHDTAYYNVTNGLVSQSLLNNLVTDWYGKLEIARCNPWQGPVAITRVRSNLGVTLDGSIEGKTYDLLLTAWKDTEFNLGPELIRMKKGEQLRKTTK